MKRIFAMLSLLLAVLAGFSACGGEQPTPDEPVLPATTREEIENLLTTDYIVGYLWYCDGLPEKGELTEDEYLPVDEESGYATLRDLQELLEKTYTPAVAAELLENKDTLGRPRFTERAGTLYKSSRPVFSRYYWDYDAESVTITGETADRITFTVEMENLHTGEKLPLTRSAEKTAEGWRLTEVGIAAAEAGLTAVAAEETRAVAERFVAALAENDTETIAACAGETPETYENWKGMTIPAAEITETLEEYDGCGRYRVHLTVENAFSVFAMGNNFVRLLGGLWVTIWIALVSVAFSIVLGFGFGILMTFKNRAVKIICRIYLEIMRIMPQMVLLFVMYYGLTRSMGISLSGEAASILVFTLWGTAEMGDLVRSSLESVPKHQYESGKAVGLTDRQIFMYIIIPQTLQSLIPLSMNLITRMIKTTSLVVFVGVIEVVKIGQQIVESNRLTIPTASIAVYFVIFMMYFFVCWLLSLAARYIEKRQKR